MSAQTSPTRPADSGSKDLRIAITDGLVRRFAALTGDVSSLHVDDAFARRSAYRQSVAHGMLPLAFLPLVEDLYVGGQQCLVAGLTGRFSAPVYPGDTVALTVSPGRVTDDPARVDFDYRVVAEGSGSVSTSGVLSVRYRPAAAKSGQRAEAGAAPASAPTLLMDPPPLESHALESIQVGQLERALDFRVTDSVLHALRALLAEGAGLPAAGPLDSFDLPTLSALLLLSTSVGVCMPGATATFLDFSATIASPMEMDTDYRLQGRVAHRSKATSILKKALTVTRADGTGGPLLEAKVSTLVNKPGRAMPSSEELRTTALDLGLRGKVVLVTGASRGIGETVAKLFALSGSRVVVNYHRGADDADRVVREIEAAGGEAVAVGADVTDASAVGELVRRSVDRFGTIDVLVNNAARDYRPVPFLRLTWGDIQKDLDVIAKGAFLCCQEVVPIMLERGGGKIVNIGSSATEVPPPDQLKYVMAKSALVGLTRSLALELAPRNVSVNMVVPHFVETDFVAHVQEGFRKAIADEIPIGRLGSAVDVAQAVVFLASSYASFTTGQQVMVTGGAAPLL